MFVCIVCELLCCLFMACFVPVVCLCSMHLRVLREMYCVMLHGLCLF